MSNLGNKEIMAKNIKYYMERQNIRPKDICTVLKFPMATFSDWIHAKSYPRIDKIEMMANYFGISKSDLVEDRGTLSKKDERDIKKDLDSLMEKLSKQECGPAAYDGEDIPEADQEMFAGQVEIMLRRLKMINKEKYNPNKNQK